MLIISEKDSKDMKITHDRNIYSESERKAKIFASLGHLLIYVKTAKDAAQIILNAADDLLHWDAATFDIYDPNTHQVKSILNYDTVNGGKKEFLPEQEWKSPSKLASKAITEGAQLLYRDQSDEVLIPFGDTSQVSQTIIVVPVKNGIVHGTISIQSYTKQFYSHSDVGVLQDLADHCASVIERIQLEMLLSASEARMRAIMENNTDFITLIDPEGTILFGSHTILRNLGFSIDELVGANAFQLIHVDDVDNVKTAFHNLLQSPDSTRIIEFRFYRKDKTWCWFECRAKNKIADPLIKAIIVNARDITERKRFEIELEQNAKQYRMMFENNPMPMWAYDLETKKILGVNRSAIKKYEYSEEEFLSMNANDIQSNSDTMSLQENALNDQSAGFVGLMKHKVKNGNLIDVEVTAHKIEYNGKNAELVMALDVTEKIILEEHFHNTQKMESIGTLSGGIAHDFNNILGIILAHASSLELRMKEVPEVKKNTSAIKTAVKRGADIVKQLLTFARKKDLTIEKIDVNAHITEMKKMLVETLPRDIDIVLDLSNDVSMITADSTQLQQVFLNLAVNARDAMPNGGILKFTTRIISGDIVREKYLTATEEKYISIEVSDSGVGMNEETVSHIFEPFFTTKDIGKGTGLGLSVVYGVVSKHNGFVDVTSEEGKGTTFTIAFPVSKRDDKIPVHSTDIEQISLEGKETILLIEDEELLRNLIELLLTEKGYTVITASDGVEALEIYREKASTIDIIISDIGLPRMNGELLLKRLKELNADVKIILASGYIEPERKEILLNEGALGFVNKPFNFVELLTMIRRNLNLAK